MTGNIHPKKTLLELAELIEKTQLQHIIYSTNTYLFNKMKYYASDMMGNMPIDQQIYFVLLVNEATK